MLHEIMDIKRLTWNNTQIILLHVQEKVHLESGESYCVLFVKWFQVMYFILDLKSLFHNVFNRQNMMTSLTMKWSCWEENKNSLKINFNIVTHLPLLETSKTSADMKHRHKYPGNYYAKTNCGISYNQYWCFTVICLYVLFYNK